VHLVAVLERLGRMGLTAVDDQQDQVLIWLNLEANQQIGQRASGRERHLKAAQRSRRCLPLKRRVEVNGDYQLKMLSRSDSDAS
jgi:hypothetical protein